MGQSAIGLSCPLIGKGDRGRSAAPDRRTTQYFEMFGNRAIYHEGWVAATRHSIPWLMVQLPPLSEDVWELYNVDEDFSQANNLAAEYPAKLKELQDLFLKEAERNHVLPLDDRRSERFNPAIAGRPDLMGGRKSLTVYDGMTGIMENAFINVKGVAHSITAEVVVPDAGAEGVIIAQAGYFGGWALYLKDGKANHVYNFFGLEHTKVASDAALAPGEHTIHYEFTPDEAKPGTGGKSVLSIDGKVVAEGYIPKTQPFAFSADEGADVGIDGLPGRHRWPPPPAPRHRRRGRSPPVGVAMPEDLLRRDPRLRAALVIADPRQPVGAGEPPGQALEFGPQVLLHRLPLSRGPRGQLVACGVRDVANGDLHGHGEILDRVTAFCKHPRDLLPAQQPSFAITSPSVRSTSVRSAGSQARKPGLANSASSPG